MDDTIRCINVSSNYRSGIALCISKDHFPILNGSSEFCTIDSGNGVSTFFRILNSFGKGSCIHLAGYNVVSQYSRELILILSFQQGLYGAFGQCSKSVIDRCKDGKRALAL
mgnify:CR=1 FL=1